MKKILNFIEIGLMAVAAISVILWLALGDELSHVGWMLWVAYIYLGISVVLLIAMTAINAGKTKGNSRIGLYVWGVTVLLGIILYFVGSSTAVVGADGTVFDHVFTLKSTDMMLYLAYVLLAGTVGSLAFGVIWKAIK
jgi:hypothetical protein